MVRWKAHEDDAISLMSISARNGMMAREHGDGLKHLRLAGVMVVTFVQSCIMTLWLWRLHLNCDDDGDDIDNR